MLVCINLECQCEEKIKRQSCIRPIPQHDTVGQTYHQLHGPTMPDCKIKCSGAVDLIANKSNSSIEIDLTIQVGELHNMGIRQLNFSCETPHELMKATVEQPTKKTTNAFEMLMKKKPVYPSMKAKTVPY